ncbi:hypothetical protein KIPB_003125 [Kipferlia bialata]|uniref:Uncharacterized protein n=1 Tax=Kipferlia bialata TaxID=797122 RepID=A0A9K3CRZ8_9EUKA|nr:hypothetical protein KIPB_003125 [Kipferlia bialata]|eukprot:g3125.t1
MSLHGGAAILLDAVIGRERERVGGSEVDQSDRELTLHMLRTFSEAKYFAASQVPEQHVHLLAAADAYRALGAKIEYILPPVNAFNGNAGKEGERETERDVLRRTLHRECLKLTSLGHWVGICMMDFVYADNSPLGRRARRCVDFQIQGNPRISDKFLAYLASYSGDSEPQAVQDAHAGVSVSKGETSIERDHEIWQRDLLSALQQWMEGDTKDPYCLLCLMRLLGASGYSPIEGALSVVYPYERTEEDLLAPLALQMQRALSLQEVFFK